MAYPIPISKIKRKIQKKINHIYSVQNVLFFEDAFNVKEITNEFGEKLIRVDGDIPRNLRIEEGKGSFSLVLTKRDTLTAYIGIPLNFFLNYLAG